MRRSSEPEERAQFTVAELLARYGESAPATTGRRRRRAAEEPGAPTQTAAPPITHPNRAPRREPTTPPSGPLLTPDEPPRKPSGNGRAARSWAPAVTSPPGAAPRPPATPQVTPPVVARRAPLTGAAVTDGPITEQLPRYNPASTQPGISSSRRPTTAQPVNAPSINTQPVKVTAPPTVTPPAKVTAPAAPAQARSVSAQAPAGLTTAVQPSPGQDGAVGTEVDTEDAESVSPLWEWAAMVSQVGLGVVGGATLWLICEWLWQRIPVLALVVALGLITAMVWIVRRVRRAEDLQTTVIAVLVGLFVTVSPAALLLVSR